MTAIRLERVSKRMGTTLAVGGIDLTVPSGELFFVLGPSGCGKSTLLNLIAGFSTPTDGRIWFDEQDVTRLGTEQRQAVMCFQSYALWPHLSVRENVRFGLDVRKVSRSEAERRVDRVLELVQMRAYGARKPTQLSGGQQQRVALARALAVQPRCLLLDEPLSNLDAKLRNEMRNEIRGICKSEGLTTLYVTHDQKEALAVGERIAVMLDGRFVQVGTPEELYRRPQSAFIAEFISHSNLIPAHVIEPLAGSARVQTCFGPLLVNGPPEALRQGEAVTLGIRPSQIRLLDGVDPHPINTVPATVRESSFLGETSEHRVSAGQAFLRMVCAPARSGLSGEVRLVLAPSELIVFKDR